MGLIFYNIFLQVYRVGASVASLFSPKARLWVKGRKNIFERLEKMIPAGEKIVWMHCASLGEFEQGRPLMEGIRKNYPGHKILLSFFSPSGYEVQKNYPGADWVIYMPLDGPRTAKRFLEMVRPVLVIFVKYEFWFYYLKKISYRNIPLLLVSAYLRKDMSFFKWHGSLQRKMLSRFDHLFVQDENSKQLLDGIGLSSITSVSGDTRFDRVLTIAESAESLPLVEKFIGSSPVLIAGSTWPQDELILQKTFAKKMTGELRLVIAPHEIDEKHLNEITDLFPGSVRYSSLQNEIPVHSQVLIIDNFGLLSRLYKYATFCYVGGGMTSGGVHNVLEAAVYDKLVFIGPNYEKYREAAGLVEKGGAISVKDESEFLRKLENLWNDPVALSGHNQAAGEFVRSQAGATARILSYIQEKRLLTR